MSQKSDHPEKSTESLFAANAVEQTESSAENIMAQGDEMDESDEIHRWNESVFFNDSERWQLEHQFEKLKAQYEALLIQNMALKKKLRHQKRGKIIKKKSNH